MKNNVTASYQKREKKTFGLNVLENSLKKKHQYILYIFTYLLVTSHIECIVLDVNISNQSNTALEFCTCGHQSHPAQWTADQQGICVVNWDVQERIDTGSSEHNGEAEIWTPFSLISPEL